MSIFNSNQNTLIGALKYFRNGKIIPQFKKRYPQHNVSKATIIAALDKSKFHTVYKEYNEYGELTKAIYKTNKKRYELY